MASPSKEDLKRIEDKFRRGEYGKATTIQLLLSLPGNEDVKYRDVAKQVDKWEMGVKDWAKDVRTREEEVERARFARSGVDDPAARYVYGYAEPLREGVEGADFTEMVAGMVDPSQQTYQFKTSPGYSGGYPIYAPGSGQIDRQSEAYQAFLTAEELRKAELKRLAQEERTKPVAPDRKIMKDAPTWQQDPSQVFVDEEGNVIPLNVTESGKPVTKYMTKLQKGQEDLTMQPTADVAMDLGRVNMPLGATPQQPGGSPEAKSPTPPSYVDWRTRYPDVANPWGFTSSPTSELGWEAGYDPSDLEVGPAGISTGFTRQDEAEAAARLATGELPADYVPPTIAGYDAPVSQSELVGGIDPTSVAYLGTAPTEKRASSETLLKAQELRNAISSGDKKKIDTARKAYVSSMSTDKERIEKGAVPSGAEKGPTPTTPPKDTPTVTPTVTTKDTTPTVRDAITPKIPTLDPGAFASYGDYTLPAYTDWRRKLYGGASMAEMDRLETARMPYRGYDRALGGFLLGGIAPYGTGTGTELDETVATRDPGMDVGEAQAFVDYLQGGKFGTQQDLRTRFGGLTDYLGNVRDYQEGGADFGTVPSGSYYQTFGLDPTRQDILGSATAALGYSRGMGSRAQKNLARAYDILGKQTPIGVAPTGARFADWVSTAF